MNKCFITKLPSSVDNDNLPVLGQLRINWLKQDDLSDNSQRGLWLSTNDSITVKVSGAHFTDNTLTSNLGNTKTITAADGLVALYVSNDADAILTIDNKYSLTALRTTPVFETSKLSSISFDIDDIRYCTNLMALVLQSPQVTGDISAVSNLTNLINLNLSNTQVSGDIKALSGLTKLINVSLVLDNEVSGDISAVSNLTNLSLLNLYNTTVSGDISAVSKLINITKLVLSNTQVSGDISAVSKLTNLTLLDLTNTQVSGKIDSLANLTKITSFTGFEGLSLTGDMSKIPAGANFITQGKRKVSTNLTWTAKGRQNATLLAMMGAVPFDTASMDNMLIDQATCTVSPKATESYHKIISVKGTRTSASDAAVAAIQNMGVTIIGVTKQA